MKMIAAVVIVFGTISICGWMAYIAAMRQLDSVEQRNQQLVDQRDALIEEIKK